MAPFDLRPGAAFGGETAAALRRALADAAQVIANMPARHLTFADDTPVFPATYGRMQRGDALVLNAELFWTYGSIRAPLAVWHALRRMAAWIEPMLLAEWVRLSRAYAERAGRPLASDAVLGALRWLEPERDTALVRDLASERLRRGEELTCVWTGAALRAGTIEVAREEHDFSARRAALRAAEVRVR